MCGRYRLSKRKQIIEEQFEAQPWGDDWSPRFNIAPTQRKGFGVAVAVSPLGQGQAGGSAAPPAGAGFDFHGGPRSHPAQSAGPTRGTAPQRSAGIAPCSAASSLRRAQTQAVRGVGAGRPGRGRYPGRASGAGSGLQTVHRARPGLALGCDPSSSSRHRAIGDSFLDTLQHRMPFPIRALQVDGGSEFAADFEAACQQRGLHLFVLPPRSPKLNGAVERANRTHTEEFYQVTPCSLEMNPLNRELRQWEKIYHTVRPHQALGYLTPLQFLRQHSSQPKE